MSRLIFLPALLCAICCFTCAADSRPNIIIILADDHSNTDLGIGALMKSGSSTAPQCKLRQLVIGNWGFTTEPRNFAGRMDELAVFNQALSDDEIAKF